MKIVIEDPANIFGNASNLFRNLNGKRRVCLLVCFCATAGLAGLYSFKYLLLFSMLAGKAQVLWNARYFRPCSHAVADDGERAIYLLAECGEPTKAMELAAAALKAKLAQRNIEAAQATFGYLRRIDKQGSISGADWKNLSEPFADQLSILYSSQFPPKSNDAYCRSCWLRNATRSLTDGYENHGLISEAGNCLKLLIAEEYKQSGCNSSSYTYNLLNLANLYERHSKHTDAAQVIERLHQLERTPNEFGIERRADFKGQTKYEISIPPHRNTF